MRPLCLDPLKKKTEPYCMFLFYINKKLLNAHFVLGTVLGIVIKLSYIVPLYKVCLD